MSYEQFIDLEPMPSPRHRARRIGKGIAFYHDAKYTKWLDECRSLYAGPLYDEPVELRCVFHIPRPKTVKREYPTAKNDIDNLLKSLMDGLNKAAYTDDSLVVSVSASKRYADNEPPGIWISLQ